MKTCTACNLAFSEDVLRFCDSCGKALTPSDEPTVAQASAQPVQQQEPEVGLIAAGALALGIIGVGWLAKAAFEAALKAPPSSGGGGPWNGNAGGRAGGSSLPPSTMPLPTSSAYTGWVAGETSNRLRQESLFEERRQENIRKGY